MFEVNAQMEGLTLAVAEEDELESMRVVHRHSPSCNLSTCILKNKTVLSYKNFLYLFNAIKGKLQKPVHFNNAI